MIKQHEIEIRVCYHQTDAQGRLHHAQYINYFETGRIELLRAAGTSYRKLEAQGLFLVVTDVQCRYYIPARFDDLLKLRTTTTLVKGARIKHKYQLFREDQLLAEGSSVVGCIDRDGKVQRIPQWLHIS